MKGRSISIYILFTILFLILSPITNDFYNVNNQRTFLNNILLNSQSNTVSYKTFSWSLDWPYPPLTLLLILPAWIIYHNVSNNEFLYQFLFKLPLFISVILMGNFVYSKTLTVRNLFSFLFNPGVILLTIIGGGFDIVNALLLVLTLYAYSKKRYTLSFLFLSLSIALRIYPLVMLPFLLITWIRKRKFMVVIKFCLLNSIIPIFSGIFIYFFNKNMFISSVLSQQKIFGPFGVFPIAQHMAGIVDKLGLFHVGNTTLGIGLVFLLILGEGYLFIISLEKHFPIIDSIILSLLVFLLLYPKVHALYIIILLPLGFLYKQWGLLKYLWIPGTLWAFTVNGFNEIRGIGYWFFWLTNINYSLPKYFVEPLTLILALTQEAMIGYFILSFIRKNKLYPFLNRY